MCNPQGPTTSNTFTNNRPRETAPSFNRSLSDVDYQKGSRKAVVDEINRFKTHAAVVSYFTFIS